MAVLLREVIGDVLRRARTSQGRTLREVSDSARVSLGYLSEVERGRKEASSELLSAICTALEVPMSRVLHDAGLPRGCRRPTRSGPHDHRHPASCRHGRRLISGICRISPDPTAIPAVCFGGERINWAPTQPA